MFDSRRVMFVYLWEYVVTSRHQEDFEREYGPNGSWAALFSRSPGYQGTTLLRDNTNPERFLTIDRWDSERAHYDFVESRRAEFEAIDTRCEELTESESLIGRFHSTGHAF